ncbi:dTDP-4-dehydrorhamnose reductase [Shewanella xiamenensis]|uniref:dTDP-4-dehydrorhamnose reductase n=1 Tax=Shewanella xiamenensis TaxID=332186 RepID=A0AAE4TMR8_9GAMM|nr:dTDP-4-dehydrorhamnose reductase [Shewanella xiamenensis]MDV5389604.1 dTDP-4-dehydrorhamnose reductase [Shewanella xiamenensis]
MQDVTPARPTVLLTGAHSQLAKALIRTHLNGGLALNLHPLTHAALDISDKYRVAEVFAQVKPDWVINCAAYNAVDKAETAVDEAYRVNSHGPELLATECALTGARLVHISSDYVFSGLLAGVEANALSETVTPSPLSVYGKTKLAGEQAVQRILGERAIVIRTAWLYGVDGHNFVKTMLRLMAATPNAQPLSVINDQIGSPTWVDTLALLIWQLMLTGEAGLFHYSGQGQCSWFEFAVEIQQQALALKLLKKAVPIIAIDSLSYAAKALEKGNVLAHRPTYSALNSDKLRQTLDKHHLAAMQCPEVWQDWRVQLNCMLNALITQGAKP